ncbi:hypothetical protein GO755_34780 [Spirosoma sp. HMF4905]|uniref:Tape measure protein N-terminal domain-containing protein n=1 Tax=Spirosoma arboris TaxID=2682092 RepID=A0A7K1SN65_9BACT|nr:tape measure protein [Spirosoma arboris]MVM35239.1 hypothetical protein [Spirosoma arboris]
MNSSASGALSFDALINTANFHAQLDEMERRIRGFSTTSVRETKKIDDSFQNLGRLAAGAFAFAGLSELPQQLFKVRSEVQQLEISFAVLLGSRAKADAFLKQGIEFANKTPYGLDEVAKAQKLMLAYGFSVQSIIPTLTKLGDIAAGTGSNLVELVAAYSQIKTQGTAQQDDLNKLIERGINLTPEFSRLLKINDKDVRQFVADGKIGFNLVEQAITSLVDGTGKLNFGGMMAEQAKSLTGLTSNLAAAWDTMLNQIGKDNEDLLASAITGATGLVESYEQILNPLKVLIATYGAYKSAIVLTSVVQAAANVAGNVQAWLSLATTIRSAKDAQIAFNLATSASPWVIAATAIIAVTTALIVYKKELTATQQAELDLQESRENANSQADAERAKIEQLKTTITNEKLSRDARNKALKDLIALSPEHLSALTLDSVKTQAGTKSINDYVEALKRKYEQQELDRKFTESFRRESEAKAGKNEISFFDKASLLLAQAGSDGSFDSSKAIAEQNKKLNADKIKQEQDYREQLKLEQKANDETANSTVKAETTKQKVRAVTLKQLDEAISAQREQLSLDNTDAKNSQIQRQIDALEAQRRRLTGELTPEEKKAQKEADKTGPFGSLSYYEAVSKHFEELISKTPKTDTTTLNQLNAKKLAADAQVEEIRKKLAIKSFDEEIADKKAKYELYTKWIEAYGQQAADSQFADLKASGQSYLDFLNTQIANLENERDNAGLTSSQTTNLASLLEQRDTIKQKKSPIDVFNESLQKAQVESKSLADYLVKLNEIQDKLSGKTPTTGEDFAINKRAAEEKVQTEQQLKDQVNQFLQSSASSGEQELAIRRKYNDLRLGLDKEYNGQRTEAYEVALADINTKEQREFEEFKQRKFEESEAYRNTTKVIVEEGRKQQRVEIEKQKNLVASALGEFGANSEQYKTAQKKLNELQKTFSAGTANIVSQYTSAISQLGQTLSQLGGEAGAAGSMLVVLASSVDLIAQASKKGATATERIAVGVQGLIGLIDGIATANQQRKQAETEYYQSVIAQQEQYNILLNEQLGLQAKNRENVFTTDYVGEIQDNYKKLTDAEEKYQASLKKLAEGRAKVGLIDSLDRNAAAKSTLTGAAIGTAILPGVGTVVGAVAGFVAGIFGSASKKEEEFADLLRVYPDLIKKGTNGVDELNSALAESLISTNSVDEATKQLLQTTLDWQKQIDEAKQAIHEVISTLAGSLGDDLRNSLVSAFEDGTNSAQAFGDSVSKILDNLLSQLIFNQVFSKQFDQLQKELEESVGPNGDNNWVDDFGRFFGKADDLTKLFNQGLADAQDAAKQYGLDIFKPSGSGASSATAATNAVKSIQEDTASLLVGQANAMRIQQANTNQLINQQLLVLGNIDRNTARIEKTNDLLEKIDGTISGLNDGLRAKGIL